MTPSTQDPAITQHKTPRRSGQIIILFAFFFIFILGIFVANYNLGDLVRQRIELQNAADAASLAAARSLGLGMGYLTIVNDMILSDLTWGIQELLIDMSVPLGVLFVPLHLAELVAKLTLDFVLGQSYLTAGPYLAQEAAAVVGSLNGAEFAWAVLDDSTTGNLTYSKARLNLNVPGIDDWTSGYSDMFFHLIFPRSDATFPERAVVIAWNKSSKDLPLAQDYFTATNRNMHAVSSATIYYVPQAITEAYGNPYSGRMTNLTDEWYLFCPWLGGAYWWPRLIPNTWFEASFTDAPLNADYATAYSQLKGESSGLMDAGQILGLIKGFSSAFGFISTIMNSINDLGDNLL